MIAVAPRVGAWIEIARQRSVGHGRLRVAPRVGAWIEMWMRSMYDGGEDGRSPCGSVD